MAYWYLSIYRKLGRWKLSKSEIGKVRDWDVEKFGTWKIGIFRNWESCNWIISNLKNLKIGKLEKLQIGKLENWEIRNLGLENWEIKNCQAILTKFFLKKKNGVQPKADLQSRHLQSYQQSWKRISHTLTTETCNIFLSKPSVAPPVAI